MPPLAKIRRAGLAGTLAAGGATAIRASDRLRARGGPTLAGDRWVEWSFCAARLSSGEGRTLDFGADIGFLALAAAHRGHQVIAFDRLPSSLEYTHERVTAVQGDILESPPDGQFDQIINCSSIEHVGLGGRYGSPDARDGDLRAMQVLRDLLRPGGCMILTVPVGRDLICQPYHRIYGEERLPRLLDGYAVAESQFWRKDPARRQWVASPRESALMEVGSERFYALGLFVLTSAADNTKK